MTRAILMASGLGTRLRPLTLSTPKPLLHVGKRVLIETLIEALQVSGVGEIYVCIGYLAEQFNYLLRKYSNIRFVYNPDYREANNISSIYYACRRLPDGDCYICESDLYIADSTLFAVRPETSCYFAKYVPGATDDWCFDTTPSGRILRIGKGGQDCYNMVGVSYWTQHDMGILSRLIRGAYGTPANRTLFWDEVVNRHLDLLPSVIRQISPDAIAEIDTAEELEAAAAEYA